MTKPTTDRQNIFSGPDAIKQFLDPDCNPPLPLVELPDWLNPFAEQKVRIFAKLLYLLPLLNLKSLPVLAMLQDASGELDGVHTIVENSSGNTAFSMAIMARLFGIRSVRAIVPLDIAPGKLELLRLGRRGCPLCSARRGRSCLGKANRRAARFPQFGSVRQ